MSNDETPDATGTPETDEELDLVSFDLNDDGKISPLEGARQELGLVDARLEEIAKEGGLKGKIADAAHHVLDKLDND
ncbi:MAG TPA: hypothetical protein PK020_01650 [Ilumatobacteraceae bacterium]|nr:hypothetical protein [Ilumatobacteraceae bacterium]HRB03346.1 hypothetical protein [Ilumatobacteraceae bacterium]